MHCPLRVWLFYLHCVYQGAMSEYYTLEPIYSHQTTAPIDSDPMGHLYIEQVFTHNQLQVYKLEQGIYASRTSNAVSARNTSFIVSFLSFFFQFCSSGSYYSL